MHIPFTLNTDLQTGICFAGKVSVKIYFVLINKPLQQMTSRSTLMPKLLLYSWLCCAHSCVYICTVRAHFDRTVVFVFMNGMCHKHKVSLTRHIKVRKVSVLGENGEVSWIRNEFTALKCPVVTRPRMIMISSAESDLMMSSDEREQSTNKKARNSSHGEKDQPASDQQPGD